VSEFISENGSISTFSIQEKTCCVEPLKLLFSMDSTESNSSLTACSSEDGSRTNFRNTMVSITQMVDEVQNNNT
jgi:hypothetical protein